MTGNANFATPAPTLAAVTTAVEALETAFNVAQAARLEAKQKTELQNSAEQNADALLTQLASYGRTSAGDAVKI